MSKLTSKVQQDLIRAIDQDELVLPTLPEATLRTCEVAEDPDVGIQTPSKVIGNDAALITRITRVVNSLLLRSPKEVVDLQMMISRLGINYTRNSTTGSAMKQMLQAITDVVDRRMHEVWNKSIEIADIYHMLARRYIRLAPDQATLAGLVYQISVLSILTYARDHDKLLSDFIGLSHVIERIHPPIGERILKVWDFPAPIVEVPRQHLDFTRNSPHADYTDLIQVATLQSYFGDEHPYTHLDWSQILAFAELGLEPTVDTKEDEDLSGALEVITSMLQ